VKKTSGLLFVLFSATFFLAASLSSQGDSSKITTPSVAVPPLPNPQPTVPAPPPTARVGETAPLSVQDIEHVTPVVEVWRANGRAPQIPNRPRNNILRAFVADNLSVMVRLQFDPAARGLAVFIRPGEGAVLDSAVQSLQINGNGECLLRLHLDADYNQGHFAVHCGGFMTKVILARSSQARVLAQENLTGGGQP
jgi:hypothetical protein